MSDGGVVVEALDDDLCHIGPGDGLPCFRILSEIGCDPTSAVLVREAGGPQDGPVERRPLERAIGDVLEERFDHVEERFDRVDERLDRMDERLNQMDERLNQMDERLDAMNAQMNERLDAMNAQMNERFDAMNERMDERSEQVTDQLDRMNDRILSMTRWFIGLLVFFGSMVTALLAVAHFGG